MLGIRSDCRKISHPREHWTKKKGQWKPKKCFGSLDEAKAFIAKYKYDGYKAYWCSICGCVHIGYEKSSCK